MNQPAAMPTIDVTEAAARRDGPDNPLVVDVREPDEFATVRLEGAALLPMSTFAERHVEPSWANTIVALSRSYGPILGLLGGWASDKLGAKQTIVIR